MSVVLGLLDNSSTVQESGIATLGEGRPKLQLGIKLGLANFVPILFLFIFTLFYLVSSSVSLFYSCCSHAKVFFGQHFALVSHFLFPY